MQYTAINIQGNIVSGEILEKIRTEDTKHQSQADFGLDRNTSIRDEIGIAWSAARAHWSAFQMRRERLKDSDSGTSETRQGWMIPFLRELGYDLEKSTSEFINGKSYAVSHRAANRDGFPVHLVGINQSLDKRPEVGGTRLSPHALLQEYLNNEHLYALISNGRFVRLLRDATRLSRLSYVEFDLERIMEEDLFAEFALLFRVIHASRMPVTRDSGEEAFIEYYHQEALSSGSRIREKLSQAVEKSLKLLANGLLKHPSNTDLRNLALQGNLKPDAYYLHLLRLVYRVLFLMVIEERQLIYSDKRDEATTKLKDFYYRFYSINRLTKLAEKLIYVDPRKTDLWKSLLATFQLFENGTYSQRLGIQPLGSGLFDSDALGNLSAQNLDNGTLLNVLQLLVTFENENHQRVRVNYADLDVEEFGSVYEGLLEYDASLKEINGQPTFSFITGDARSRSGSHYTPEELVKPLIKHSLDYIIEDRLKVPPTVVAIRQPAEKQSLQSGVIASETKQSIQERQLLSIRVCDVACGSGHILLSAARRIAIELACVREGAEQPSPTYFRAAMRDVVKNCIYGVDKNPLAVELCKVAFWLESHNPGEPLGFLDHHIKCGDSIVGLAHREELENGIADEAFKTLPGDEKEIAAAFLKKNRQESRIRKDKETGTQFKLTDTIDNTVQESMAEYRTFNQLPEHTPNEIAAKARAYRKFMDGKGYNFLKVMADTQVAQFFIPKTTANKDRLITDSDYLTILKGYGGWQNQQTAYAAVVAQENRFFHWFLEFPEVFHNGGFDCVLGNPPFLGGKKLSGTIGDNCLECIKYQYTPIGAVDLVTYFFRRIFTIIKQGGFQSLISTNTIAQGEARKDGLDVIAKQGGIINHAVKSMKWPGMAAVDVALVTITKQLWKGKFILDNKEVKIITPYLDDSQTLGNPNRLNQNENKSFVGSFVLGKGFILDPHEAKKIITKDPRNKDVLFPYLNGDDLNNNPDQRPSRWVINFFDWTEERAQQYPDCYKIIEQLVKPERQRLALDKDGNEIEGEYALRKPLPEKWWIYADKRPALYRTTVDMVNVLVINRHTKNVIGAFMPTNYIFSDATVVFAIDKFSDFGVFSSSFHDVWAWKNSSTMGSNTIRYSGSDAFETFPFPQHLTTEMKRKLDSIGKVYNEYRQKLMLSMQLGLTKTYNAFHAKEIRPGITTLALQSLDKKAIEKQYGKEVWNLWNHLQKSTEACSIEEAIAGIIQLRELHVQMDNAVLEAYGWHAPSPSGRAGVGLFHNFYEVDYLPENDRIRYTIHPDARKEILKRLLELNHQYYEEEIKRGLHKKADVEKFYAQKGLSVPLNTVFSDEKPERKQIRKENIPTQAVQRSLFDDVNITTMKEFSLHDGIYSIQDTAKIINQPYDKVRRWFLKLSEANYEGLSDSAKTDIDNRRISFHGLVELVVIGELLEAGVKPKKIFKAREALSTIVKKPYPFATSDVKDKLKVAGSDIVFDFDEGIITLDGTGQFNFEFVREFFADIEFKSGIAIRLLPAKGLKRVQINPQAAGGRPAFVSQKDVKVETVLRFYKGPGSIKEIIEDYDISEEDIKAALAYQS
jgi:uncharacterized protein (DUF433 family)